VFRSPHSIKPEVEEPRDALPPALSLVAPEGDIEVEEETNNAPADEDTDKRDSSPARQESHATRSILEKPAEDSEPAYAEVLDAASTTSTNEPRPHLRPEATTIVSDQSANETLEARIESKKADVSVPAEDAPTNPSFLSADPTSNADAVSINEPVVEPPTERPPPSEDAVLDQSEVADLSAKPPSPAPTPVEELADKVSTAVFPPPAAKGTGSELVEDKADFTQQVADA